MLVLKGSAELHGMNRRQSVRNIMISRTVSFIYSEETIRRFARPPQACAWGTAALRSASRMVSLGSTWMVFPSGTQVTVAIFELHAFTPTSTSI